MTRDMGEVYYDMLKLITFKRKDFRSKADLARALSKEAGRTITRQRVQQLVLKALARGDLIDDPFTNGPLVSYNPNMIRHGRSRHPRWRGQSKEQLSEQQTLNGDETSPTLREEINEKLQSQQEKLIDETQSTVGG